MRLGNFHPRLPNPFVFYGVCFRCPAFTLVVSNYVVAQKALRVSPQFKVFKVDKMISSTTELSVFSLLLL